MRRRYGGGGREGAVLIDFPSCREHFLPMARSDVLEALAAGAGVEDLLADFPYLSQEDVRACLAYGARAVDHSVVQAA